ncbi:innexin inx2-like [Galendromus occidentalis]|uniref:Innexin n=1 Tax=Galendromus occidentalis TaxID=34638 RepID=A0AAJ6QTN3_9ACAR|nr:innexin inx2-like [Galendromus occidentalis]
MATINAMLDLLVQPMYNAIRGSPVKTNNVVAKLHYKVTSAMLIIVGFLITSAEHFGNAIDCLQQPETVPNQILETYCWIHSTFTLPFAPDTAHPGVYNARNTSRPVYHRYYQWVCLVLIMQSIFFYLPRYIWRLNENGFFTKLISTDDDEILTEYMITHKGTHAPIATYFHVGEALFLINLVGQILLTDVFLNYQFLTLGIVSMTTTGHLQKVFPRMAKCTFHLYGPSGDLERQDALCLLGQNVVNEKIFLFLWFWYLFLLVASSGITLWRLASFFSTELRVLRLMKYFNQGERFKLRKICEVLDYADWYVLTTISKNISPISARKFYLTLYRGLVVPDKRYGYDTNLNGSPETMPLN